MIDRIKRIKKDINLLSEKAELPGFYDNLPKIGEDLIPDETRPSELKGRGVGIKESWLFNPESPRNNLHRALGVNLFAMKSTIDEALKSLEFPTINGIPLFSLEDEEFTIGDIRELKKEHLEHLDRMRGTFYPELLKNLFGSKE